MFVFIFGSGMFIDGVEGFADERDVQNNVKQCTAVSPVNNISPHILINSIIDWQNTNLFECQKKFVSPSICI